MARESYSEALSGVLKVARDSPLIEKNVGDDDRTDLLRAAALVAVYSMIGNSEGESQIARDPGSAWTQDHRRTHMGRPNLMASRSQRATWR